MMSTPSRMLTSLRSMKRVLANIVLKKVALEAIPVSSITCQHWHVAVELLACLLIP